MKLLALALLLVSSLSFGSGKVAIEPAFYPRLDKVTPKIGLSIYEPLFMGFAYNAWTGVGWQPRASESAVFWLTSRHDIEKWFGDLGISVGFTFRHAEQQGVFEIEDQNDVHVKFQYKLW